MRNDEKWDPESRARIFKLLAELTKEGVREGADLVIWAETAAPCYVLKDREWGPVVQDIAIDAGVPIFLGLPDYQVHADRRVTYTNTAALVDASGNSWIGWTRSSSCLRRHVPFSRNFKILEKVDFGEADFIPGHVSSFSRRPEPDSEISFALRDVPHLSRRYVREGADLPCRSPMILVRSGSRSGAARGDGRGPVRREGESMLGRKF